MKTVSGANLTGAALGQADLTDADLTGANMTRANLSGSVSCSAKVFFYFTNLLNFAAWMK
jgi:uncharacterized protein YjbI with pentapeptide repeats